MAVFDQPCPAKIKTERVKRLMFIVKTFGAVKARRAG